jgi:hypothetical protein
MGITPEQTERLRGERTLVTLASFDAHPEILSNPFPATVVETRRDNEIAVVDLSTQSFEVENRLGVQRARKTGIEAPRRVITLPLGEIAAIEKV